MLEIKHGTTKVFNGIMIFIFKFLLNDFALILSGQYIPELIKRWIFSILCCVWVVYRTFLWTSWPLMGLWSLLVTS